MKAARLGKALFVAVGVCLAYGLTPASADPPDYCCYPCGVYGDGSDGDRVITGYVSLYRDYDYHDLTIEPGGTLNTRGYRVRVCGTLWVKSGGRITDDYSRGDFGEGGEAGKGGNPYGAPNDPTDCGRVYDDCTNGEDGEAGGWPRVPEGGYGGGGGGGGGGGAECTNPLCPRDADGGNGGGAVTPPEDVDDGDGGDGGGYVLIYAYRLNNQDGGAIDADGEDAEDGQDAPFGYWSCGGEYYWWTCPGNRDLGGGGGGGGGGGCGGDGGTVEVYYDTLLNEGQIHAYGGNGGDGGLGGDPAKWQLDYGVILGYHQYGCSGGNGCYPGTWGDGGDGGEGEHRRGYWVDDGEDGENGRNGANGVRIVDFLRCCPGDIDGDGDTDHSDLGELLSAWCSHEGDPNWNPCADLDGDGHVGHGDLGILLSDWGCGTEP